MPNNFFLVTIFKGAYLQEHVSDLLLNVLGLVAHGHLGEAGQIDEGNVEDVWRVDAQIDRQVGYALVGTGHPGK